MITKERIYACVVAFLVVLVFVVPTYAAEISNVTISNTTATSTTISWTTDQPTDATINYGLDASYGLVRDPTLDSKKHTLTITNLDPATPYHFQVGSTDKEGNKSATAGFVFTTVGSQSAKIKSEISKVVDPKTLEQIAEQVKATAGVILKPPAIVGAPKVAPDTSGATITWSTDRESGSEVSLVPAATYDANSSDPYTIHQGDSKESVTKHSVVVIGLIPSTQYHFQATSDDTTGLTGVTEDDTFTTKSILPQIGGIKISRIQENSANISWSTNGVLAQGLIDYTDLRSHKKKSFGDPVYTTKHSVQLTGLTFGTHYQVVIRATNQGGDEVDSKPLTFLTVRDVVSPIISKVNNESTLFPSDDVKIQTIISWVTDEPANCQLFYTQGLVHDATNKGSSMPEETNPLTQHTQVVVGFAPASVYKFWMMCHDVANNPAQSDDYVLITPTKEQNIIDLILSNFQGTFGWVNNIGGGKK